MARIMTAKDEQTVYAAASSPKKFCCTAKNCLQTNDLPPRLCIAATRSLTELSAFLDVSSLNLAVPAGAAIFFSGEFRPPGPTRHPGLSRSAAMPPAAGPVPRR